MTDTTRTPLAAIVGALGGVYLIWGSTYFAIRVAIDTMPPLLMAGVRFLLAGLILYAAVGFRGGSTRERPTRQHWGAAFIIGAALLGIGNGGVTLGEQTVATGIVALLVASIPLWMALFAWLLFRERLSAPGILGIVVGVAGVGLLLNPHGAATLGIMAVILLSPLGWAAGSLYARGAPRPQRALVGTAMEMIAGGGVLIFMGLVHGEAGAVHLNAFSLSSVAAFAYLIVFGSLVGYSCYVWLLHTIPTRIVATYAYVNPLVAVALGWAFLGEQPTARVFLAGGLIIVSVALILAFPAGKTVSDDLLQENAVEPG